ncbi:MAG: TolC family protein, partial [Hymenobacter sp.]
MPHRELCGIMFGFRLFLVGLLGLPLAGWGQAAAPLTLGQALAQARTSYPTLRARQASVVAATADVRTLRSNYLPQVSVQLQALDGTSNQARGALLGGIGPNVSGVREYTSYQASWASQGMLYIDWPAVTFGRYRADVQRAEASVTQAQADYDQELFTHQVQVADAYLLALSAQKTVALQTANLQRSLALRRIVLAGTRAGIQAGIDSSTANAEAARARLQVLVSRQQAEQQRTRLA